MATSEAEADNTETETEAPDTEMSARKLEDFIHLIEAAERVSSEVKLPRSGQHFWKILFQIFLLITVCSYFSLSSDRSTARPASARPQPSTLVPNLKLPLKETPSPSHPRLALTFENS